MVQDGSPDIGPLQDLCVVFFLGQIHKSMMLVDGERQGRQGQHICHWMVCVPCEGGGSQNMKRKNNVRPRIFWGLWVSLNLTHP